MIDQYENTSFPYLYVANGVGIHSTIPFSIPITTVSEAPIPRFYIQQVHHTTIWTEYEWDSAQNIPLSALSTNDEIRILGDTFLCTLPNIGYVKIQENCISVAPQFLHNPHLMEMEVLENIIGGLMAKLGYLTFHASAVELPKGALLLAATSGSGKSSLTVELLKQGAIFLSDDMVVLHPDNHLNRYMINPSHYCLRLNKDSAIELLNEDYYQRMYPKYDETKRFTHVNKWAKVATAAKPLIGIVIINGDNMNEGFVLEKLRPHQAFKSLSNHVIGALNWNKLEKAKYLMKVTDVLKNIPCYQLNYEKDYNLLPKVAKYLLKHFI